MNGIRRVSRISTRSLAGLAAIMFAWASMTAVASAQLGSVATVEAELVSAQDAIKPGEPFWVGLRLKHAPAWHTYWINPGDAGYPTSIRWTLPEGFGAGELLFPYPHLFEGNGGMAGYGYTDEAILLTKITPSATLSTGSQITLLATAKWLVCDPSQCVPGSAELSLTLPVADSPGPSAWNSAIESERRNVPARPPDWSTESKAGAETITLTITAPERFAPPVENFYFFPEPKNLVSAGAAQRFAVTAEGQLEVTLTKHPSATEVPEMISGVLYSPAGFGALGKAVQLSTGDEPAAPTSGSLSPRDAASTAETGGAATQLGLWTALLFAFLGGIILNIMPCVFPVISLKIMSFVKQAGEDRRRILHHGLAFGAGVMIFFWILAGLLLAVRAGGQLAGWGVHLQQPGFVMAMAVLMILIAMNLFGVFEMGTSMTGVGGKLISGSGLAGSFWSGALATLLATPCTGPFMASALGFAVGKPPAVSILIFTSLGLGMALPYLLLSAFPGLIQKLPRPGPWMETFKQLMGFPMLAVAAWLFVVLSVQLSSDGMLIFFGAILLIAFAAWIYGRYATPVRKPRTKTVTRAATLALAALAVALFVKSASMRAPYASTDIAAVIESHRREGKNVFVDFTAVWCAICQSNKPAMHSEAVTKAFKDHNVEFIIADYTNFDPQITAFLQRYSRDGVPFYPLFPSDTSADPLILPQNLTPGIIIDYVEKLE